MDQIVCYPESTFGQRMEVTCVRLNRNWFYSLAIYASTNVQHIWRQCTENGHEYKGNWAPQVLVWSPLEARGSCTYEVLHLLKQAFCRKSMWSLRLPWLHSPDRREERTRKLGLGPFWIKATIADELSYPSKVPLCITFFSWKSQIEYLHWRSALAVWILGGGENVCKLVNIQELEENRLSCQNLFNLFWKIFPLGTLSCLEQVPNFFFQNTAEVTCLLLSLQNLLKSNWLSASPNPYKLHILLWLCCYGHWAHAPCQPCSLCSCSLMVPGVLSPFRTPICQREGKCVWKPAQELYSSAVSHSCLDITAVVAEESWRTAFSVSLALSCCVKSQLVGQTLVALMAGFADTLHWGWELEGCAAGLRGKRGVLACSTASGGILCCFFEHRIGFRCRVVKAFLCSSGLGRW